LFAAAFLCKKLPHLAFPVQQLFLIFWQRRCRAAAAGAVLKPQGGNCAVLPQLTALVAGVQSIKIRRQLGRLAAFILLKKIAHKFNVFTLNS